MSSTQIKDSAKMIVDEEMDCMVGATFDSSATT